MFYLVGLSYLDAADHLTRSLEGPPYCFRLPFDEPVRHLYAHALEMFQKACLFEQGVSPAEMKKEVGHWLVKAFDRIDRQRFADLRLDDELREYAGWLDMYHPTKEYAYPYTGYKEELALDQLREGLRRFRVPRTLLIRLFPNRRLRGLRFKRRSRQREEGSPSVA